MGKLGNIDNVYTFLIWIFLLTCAVGLVVTLLMIILKRSGKLTFKKGDFEIGIESKRNITEEYSINTIQTVQQQLPGETQKEIFCTSVQKSLTEHLFFSDMLKWEKRDIGRLMIKSDKKKFIIVEFLKIKFRVFREILKAYVISAEAKMNSGEDFHCDDIQQVFLECIDKYNNEARNTELKFNGRIMTGIPEMFLEEFDCWYTPHIDMINESIKQIVNNEIYPDEKIKLLAIIEIFYISFNLTIHSAVGSINELNGELECLLEEKLGA